ncbi:hypothetical protein [Halorarius halobius]|uniref:hypothetical protein n=1 Tax=Halorarius halobius TaxID=2962671 RepID=UPI0020CBF47E|nr:hypothetical protein [Halorarius halobius]
MPSKLTGPGTVHEIGRFDGGVGWLAHPEETMRRASHALATEGGVFVVDPVDADGLDDLLAEFGEVAGVVVLLEYHTRHAERIAARHDVPVYLPAGLTGVDLGVPVRRFSGALPATTYDLLPVTVNPLWKEWALFDGETLVVAEAVGATDYFLAPGETDLGVSYLRRPFPPEALAGLDPERVLVGHGAGVHEDAAGALATALDSADDDLLDFYRANGRTMLRNLRAAVTT